MKTDSLFTQKEALRLEIQASLDAAKTQEERNKMGQFATPSPLASEILRQAKKLIPRGQKVRFLDPALGSGAFYSALLREFPASRIMRGVGYEIDPHYGNPAARLWSDTGLDVQLSDFTKADPQGEAFNLIICNPPYVRHHHIANGDKTRIHEASYKSCGIQLSGLAGLYCHFLGLSHAWLAEGGLAGWLMPSEFMDVNYGEAVKRYLLDKVRLVHIHRFDPQDVQFGDALVSSAVVWFKKETPPREYEVEFSFGGKLGKPAVSRSIPVSHLRDEAKWTRFPLSEIRTKDNGPKLSDFFSIRRGLATGDNDFFILSASEIRNRDLPLQFFTPILPSPRYLSASEILSDDEGNPLLDDPLFLLDCRLPENVVKRDFQNLWNYFLEGIKRGVADRYLCQHRSPWYSQENRPAAPFVCTYLGRKNTKSGKPFRFILNRSRATITNVYLALYPKEPLAKTVANCPKTGRHVWEILDKICPQSMLAEGRVYGGGLHKLEPKELANVPVPALAEFLTAL